jgi:hopanoid biosynthesis associated RND transporter like protein HpnN
MTPPFATSALLARLVELCAHARLRVIIAALLLAGACAFASASLLGVSTDTGKLFASSLPWKQRAADLARLFPQNDKLIVAVVSAEIPEEADAAAASLAARLAGDHAHFTDVRRPDALAYLQKNAFLLISKADLESVLDQTIDAQPFLGALVADPSLRGLFAALGLVVQGVEHHQDLGSASAALGKFHAALDAAASGHAAPLSWQRLLGGRLADEAGRYRFVLLNPVLDYGSLQPGGKASAAVRAAAATLPEVQQGLAQVRLTGQVVLDDEEFSTVAEGALAGLVGSFLLVMLWLFLAVRSWRLMLPIMGTLVLGLVFTTGFAAVAIGTLNLVSVAFAVLFVGIAVDFAIQFTVRFRDRLHHTPDMGLALRETGRRSGTQILVAALATAAGFLAFAPTRFVGVAQLGIIAGVGMVIAFVCTLTVLPALLSLCQPTSEAEEVGFAWAAALDPLLARLRWPVVIGFAALALGGLVAGRAIPFDGDPLHTKNQKTEAIRTLKDLMQDPVTNPYSIQALLPSMTAARQAASAYAALYQTQAVLSVDSFLPADQAEKLAAISDAASLLAPTLSAPPPVQTVTAAEIRAAAMKLSAAIAGVSSRLHAGDSLLAIGEDLLRLEAAPDATLIKANDALTRFLPMQLARLRAALTTPGVTIADLPAELRADWILPDGRVRVQALPKPGVRDAGALRAWAEAALQAVPQSSGSAIYIVKSADTITGAFAIAAFSAVGAITLILALALHKARDVALVMAPLMTSMLLTALLLRMFGLDLNFANIIALPLLLGVGVSFNIYFVMNWRSGVTRFISTATARAVVFSALTTSTAFGSLALSSHPGTASMGVLLLISLACTVFTTLVFVPALLALMPRQDAVTAPSGLVLINK